MLRDLLCNTILAIVLIDDGFDEIKKINVLWAEQSIAFELSINE